MMYSNYFKVNLEKKNGKTISKFNFDVTN